MADSIMQPNNNLSQFHLRTLFVWFISSAFVLFEPAPFDLLFPVVGFIFLTRKGALTFPKESRVLFPCILLFIIANLLPMLGVDDLPRASFYVTITIYMLLLSSFIALLIMNFGNQVIHSIMGGYTFIAVISAVLGVLGVMHFLPSFLTDQVVMYDRAKAFFKDPNVYAPFLIVPMMYSVDRLFADKKRMIMWGGAALILLFGVLVSFSRAAWGVSVVAVVGYFLMISLVEGRFTQFLKYMAYFLLFASISGGVLIALVSEGNMMDFINERIKMQDYDSDRFAVQHAALLSGIEHPIGIGPGQAEMTFESVALRRTGATHSLYLRIFSETGILGFLSFLGILVVTIRKILWLSFFGIPRYRGLHCALATAFGATLINSFVIDSLHWRHFFIQIGLIWGLDIYNHWHPTEER